MTELRAVVVEQRGPALFNDALEFLQSVHHEHCLDRCLIGETLQCCTDEITIYRLEHHYVAYENSILRDIWVHECLVLYMQKYMSTDRHTLDDLYTVACDLEATIVNLVSN